MNGRVKSAIKLVEGLIKDLDDINQDFMNHANYDLSNTRLERWKDRAIKILSREINAKEGEKFSKLGDIPLFLMDPPEILMEEVKEYRNFLITLKEELEKYPGDILDFEDNNLILKQEEDKPTISRDVFVVHGHDEAAKQSVARFLERLELQPIILHEQPSGGKTIIEKFENYSNVGFAVILLTPDDVGSEKGRKHELKPRARQNVIFELGFFVGRLSRKRVCVLYKEEVEIPTDYLGVLYVLFDDAEGWKFKLAKEIKEAGIEIDLNKAY